MTLERLITDSFSSRSLSCSRRYSFSMLTATRLVTSSSKWKSSSEYLPDCFFPSTRMAIKRSRLIKGMNISISFDFISSLSCVHSPKNSGRIPKFSLVNGFRSRSRYFTTGLPSLSFRLDNLLSLSLDSTNWALKSSLPASGKSRHACFMPIALVTSASNSPPCSLRLKTLCIVLAKSDSFRR